MQLPDTYITSHHTPKQLWQALHIFNVYRLVTVSAVTITTLTTNIGIEFGQHLPEMFHYSIVLWLILIIIGNFAGWQRQLAFELQVYTLVFTDIVFICMLVYANSGVTGGLGALLLVTVSASGILLNNRASFAFAALSTLAIFSIQGYLSLTDHTVSTSLFTQNGLLGASLFAVALLFYTLTMRMQKTEALAKQRKEEILDLSKINELVIAQMETGLIVVGKNHTIQLMNEAAYRLILCHKPQLGNPLNMISSELDTQLQQWHDTLHYEAPTFLSSNGTEILPQFKKLHQKPHLSVLIFLTNISLLTQYAQQSRLASLGRLTASIAHEIRNPLSAITHAGQLLSENHTLSPDDRRLTEIIQQQSQRLDTMIINILSLSRKKAFKPKWFDIGQWLKQFNANLVKQKQIDNQHLTTSLPEQVLEVHADATHLEQIMSNLYENSTHHASQNGQSIILKVSCCKNNTTQTIDIDIIDNGDGVCKEHRDKLFEPFFTTRSSGTGLGLFIARELAQLNHANLQYIDSPEPGAHFRLQFNRTRSYA